MGIKLGKVVKMTDVKLPSRRIGSMYDPLLEAIKKNVRKVGQGYKTPIPRGLSGRVFLNRLTGTLKRLGLPDAPKGARWSKSTLDGGKEVVIGLVAIRGGSQSAKSKVKAQGRKVKTKRRVTKHRKVKARKPRAHKPKPVSAGKDQTPAD